MKKTNTAINTLGYTGVVTLSQYINSKKIVLERIHNTGGNPLFNFLADCLVGDFDIASLDRPTKVMLLDITEDSVAGTKTISRASSFIYLLTKPEKIFSLTAGTVKYSFVIPRDILESTNFNSIGLYNNSATELDYENYAALCKVDTSNADISASSVLVIDWELTISNKNS